jgi:hypothetical protein
MHLTKSDMFTGCFPTSENIKSGSFAFKFLVFIGTEHTDFITSVLLELSCLLDYPFYMYASDAQHPNK